MTRRLFSLVIWGALLACTVEVACRLFLFPEYTAMLPNMYTTHPVIGHFNRPNLTVRRYNPMNYDVINHTNSLGLRGREKNREKELGGIWVMGSSNTFGGYVEDEEVFSARLRKYGYWAANLASENHAISQQVLVLRNLARLGYRPRAVLVDLPMFHTINDYSENYDAFTAPLGEGLQTRAAPTPLPREKLIADIRTFYWSVPREFRTLRVRLLKSSATYGWLKIGIMGIPALRDWTLKAGLRSDLDFAQYFDLNLLRPLSPGNPALETIVSTADYVAALQKMIRETFDVPFGAVILPAHLQLHPQSFRRFVKHYGLGDQDLDPRRPTRKLMEALRERGVPVLDVYPALMDSGISRMTFPDDGHLIADAHAIVAKTLAGWLANEMELAPDADKDD